MNKNNNSPFWRLFLPKLISVMRYGYGLSEFRKDVFAGFTVAIVALPLSMALAIASGTTPDKGLFTAIVAGFVISFFGGSRFQIGGPTGAFVVLVFNTIEKHGYDGLVITTIMAGIILVISALLKVGNYIKYVPYPVVTGFTTGIALIIFSSQVKDILGLTIENVPADFLDKWIVYFKNINTIEPKTTFVAAITLAVILLIRKYRPSWPSFLIAMAIGMLANYFMINYWHVSVETIGSRFGGIPSALPSPKVPEVTFERVKILFPDAVVIAFLAGVESLLSAIVADGMTGRRHRSNCELLAQGLANIASGLFGGIPATGAIARTATNIRAGAYSPVSGVLHAVFIFVFMALLAPLASSIPLASLGAILVIVAWNMSEFHRFRSILIAPRGDSVVLVMTFLLTVFVDLTVAIEFGVIASAFIFMHRMSQAVEIQNHFTPVRPDIDDFTRPLDDIYIKDFNLPKGIQAFRVSGPLFFGVSSKLSDITANTQEQPHTIVLCLDAVPLVDISAGHALTEFMTKCRKKKIEVVVSTNTKQVRSAVKKSVLNSGKGLKVTFANDFDAAIRLVTQKAS